MTNIVTIRNRQVFGTKVNLGRILPISSSAFSTGSFGSEIEILRGATFGGETDFTYEDEDGSIAEVDTTANTITGGELLASKVFAEDTEIVLAAFNDIIQSGSAITIAMRVLQNPSADLGATLVWEEEF